MKIDVNQATCAQTEKEDDKDGEMENKEEAVEHDKVLLVNGPYVYVLWNKLTKTPLLMGQLCDPAA
jgi:uncharacterized membrane protein